MKSETLSTLLRIFFFVCVILFVGHLSAQTTCTPVFQKYYGGEPENDDEALSVAYCKGGGMIVCGQTTSYSAGQYDGFLLKLSDNGTPEWTKIIGSASNDQLVKVRQTTDGGFIALGETTSMVAGQTWLVKTDALGNIQWNRRYYNQSANRQKPKDIIQMADGGYCLAINADDNLPTADALIVKLNSSGIVLWSKVLDHGEYDGVNSIAEYNDTLLVAGYVTGDGRDAVVTRLNKSNGTFISAKKYTNRSGYHDEALSIEVLENGIAFSISSALIVPLSNFNTTHLTHFKLNNNGSITYQRKAEVMTTSGYLIEQIQSRATDDHGFIYLANDTLPAGYSRCVKTGPYGKAEWGRNFQDFGYKARTTGMDITSDKGFVFAGFSNEYIVTALKNKVQVFKTDRLGKTGKCNLQLALSFTDSSHYTITNFNWNSIQPSNVQESKNEMNVSNNQFSVINSCEQTICNTVQMLQEGCSTNFLAEYKSEQNIEAFDVAKLADGTYALAGNYRYYWNQEPVIIKTNPNGSIAWAKTFNDFIHSGYFVKILPISANAMLVMGTDNYTINHGSTDSAIVMKIDFAGKVLWSRKYARNSENLSDMQATDDGGCILTMNENYGSGSNQTPIVLRLDANGNIVWKKTVNSEKNLIVRNMLFDGNSIYVCGNAYINYEDAASLMILKLDAATGNFMWQKTLRNTLSQSLYPISLEKIGDSVIAVVHILTPIGTLKNKRDVGFIKLNPENGSSYGAYKVTNIDHDATDLYYGQTNPAWSARSGNDIIFANAGVLNSDTSLYITRVSSDGKLVWSKKYLNLKKHTVAALRHVDNGFVMTGKRTTGLLQDNNVPEIYPYILKTDEKGNISENPASSTCINTNYEARVDTFSVMETYALAFSVEPLPESLYSGYLNHMDYKPYVRDVKKQSTVFCSTASNCNVINITGPDSICNLQNVVQFKLQKNTGCNAAALWQTDTAYCKIMLVTDSTISLSFKKAGTSLLKASITSGCTGLSAEKAVTIIRSASNVSLGADTVLCANNSYTLNAGQGYKNYTWSHTSKADSIATISTTGIYKLTVTDFCNNISSDIISITPARFIFSAGPDTSKCNTDSLVLTATTGFMNYLWRPAYNLQSIAGGKARVFPAIDTMYTIEAEKWPGCFVRDTIRVHVKTSPSINLGADKSFCAGDSAVFKAPAGFKQTAWSNGSTNLQMVAQTAGIYSLIATTGEGCKSYDTVKVLNVFANPKVTLDHANSFCSGSSKILDAGQFSGYLWNDGSTGKTLAITGVGTYAVQVVDQNACKGADTTVITSLFSLPAQFLPRDTAVCSYSKILLQASKSYTAYLWNDGTTSSSITIAQPGYYRLQVKDANNCIGTDSIIVVLKDCMKGLYAPTAFTPNKDGKNDYFRPMLFGRISKYQLSIYNRWGQNVFATTDASKGWDGNLSGLPQDSNTFVWVCNYQLEGDEPKTEKGTVTLLR